MSQSPNNPPPNRNPYAPQPSDPQYGYEAWNTGAAPGGPSLSVLSVLSLLTSLTCLLSFLGVVLGAAALVGIQLSQGRKYGRGLAIAGIVIGLIFTSVLVGVIVGGYSLVQGYGRNVLQPGQALMQSVEKRDWRTVRATLEPGVEQTITDADLERFAADVAAGAGTFTALDLQHWQFQSDTNSSGFSLENVAPLPMPATYSNGTAVVLFIVGNNQWEDVLIKGRTLEKRLLNIIVLPDRKPPVMLTTQGIKLHPANSAPTTLPAAPAPDATTAPAAPVPPPERPATPAPGAPGTAKGPI